MKDLIKRLGVLFWKVQILWFCVHGGIAIITFFETYYLKKVIDIYFSNQTIPENYNGFLKYILVIVLLLCVNFLNVLLAKHVGKKVYADLSQRLTYQFLNLKWYDVYSCNAADTVKLLNNDINRLMPILFGFFPVLAINILAIIFYCVYLFFKSMLITVLLLIAFVILFFVSYIFDKILKKDSNAQREAHVHKESFIINMYNNFKYIFANQRLKNTLDDFNEVNEVLNETSIQIAYHSQISSFLYTTVSTITILLSFIILFFLKQKDTAITAGLVVQISTLISQALKYFSSCLHAKNQLSMASASIDRINNLYAKEHSGAVPENLPQSAEIIWEDSRESINFEYNKINIIRSANGKGKTTLLNSLCGLEHTYIPEIKLNGTLSATAPKKLCYITNTTCLRNGTVLENITENSGKLNIDVSTILQLVGIDAETKVENFGENLSAGQKQIVHILKLLNSNADVFIMDEPDSALSNEARLWLYEIMQSLVKNNNKTFVLVSHSANIMDNFDSDNVHMLIF